MQQRIVPIPLSLIPLSLILLSFLFTACTTQGGTHPSFQGHEGIHKIQSISELKTFLEESNTPTSRNCNAPQLFTTNMAPSANVGVAAVAENGGASATTKSATTYSTTNVQVAGVDEPDFVKNDNKYIYLIHNQRLLILDAYPPATARIIANLSIEGSPRDLLIDKKKLVLFTSTNSNREVITPYDYSPRRRYEPFTKVTIYDVSNRAAPKKEKEYMVSGFYHDARLTDGKVYLLTQENIRYYDYNPNLPVITDDTGKVIVPELYHFDTPAENYIYTTVARIKLDGDAFEAQSFLTGSTGTVYMSKENLYFTYKKERPRHWYEEAQKERFWNVVVPLLPADVQQKIKRIGKDEAAWPRISRVLTAMYDNMTKTEKDQLQKQISEAIDEWDAEQAREYDKTIIQKLDVRNGLKYVGAATVPGTLLNQFSMDEYEGKLRVATTTRFWTREGSQSWSNIYVMDGTMHLIGKLEKLAPDEQIYSARFLGDRLYLVTFKRTDPLFVISLKDPQQPRVLGELKIPGFSDYLHPYDEDHLIGVGKETKENEWGGVSLNGIKMALFDVSDVNHPKQIDMVKIGGPGSTTEVSKDHKAFLFDKEKHLLVLPVREVKEQPEWTDTWRYQRVWQGAYVYNVTAEGFTFRGKISHYEGEEENQWWWSSPWAIRRSLFMDNTLYTISQQKIMMNNLTTLDEVKSIELSPPPVPQPFPHPGPVLY